MAELKSQSEVIPEFIKKAIKAEIEKAIEQELTEAQKRIEKRKTEIVAYVMLDIQKYMKVNTIGEDITFTIKLKDNLSS